MRDSLTKLFGSHLVNLDILPDDAVVIDAGACVGKFIDDIQRRIGNPHIFALEPNRRNFEALLHTRPKDTIVLNVALVGAKEPKTMRFYEILRFPEWGNVTGLYTNKKHTQYMVETINIKDLLKTIPLETIHYLKMDIEGSEWDVVSDMTEEHANRIQQISMEIHGGGAKIKSKLESLGYETYWMNGEKGQGELYAVRKEL